MAQTPRTWLLGTERLAIAAGCKGYPHMYFSLEGYRVNLTSAQSGSLPHGFVNNTSFPTHTTVLPHLPSPIHPSPPSLPIRPTRQGGSRRIIAMLA